MHEGVALGTVTRVFGDDETPLAVNARRTDDLLFDGRTRPARVVRGGKNA